MSQVFKRARKEMKYEKHQARQHPINVKTTTEPTSTSLDQFIPESKIHCTDCGQPVEEKNLRYIEKDRQKKPYCRQCFLTRFGRGRTSD